MDIIENNQFGGERPLFGRRHLILNNVNFLPGESALKCTSDITATHCTFDGKYPFWHADDFRVENCLFNVGARAALWYSRNCVMKDCTVNAPKMFRELDGISLTNCRFDDAQETLWSCANILINDCSVKNADYLFMHSRNIKINNWQQQGNYSFQYCTNVEIHSAHIDSKDAFWNTEAVTVYDSELTGEYLGWYSRRLKLVRCKISGTQPLCYCRDLELVDCEFAFDCDLAFEDSEVIGNITTPITSVKNPKLFKLQSPEIKTFIRDEFSKAEN